MAGNKYERTKSGTIQDLMQEFLEKQEERLQSSSFQNYERVLNSYRIYLNRYGPNYLDKNEEAIFDGQIQMVPNATYCSLLSWEKLGQVDFWEYLNYYIPNKVIATRSYLRSIVTVLRKFAKWMLGKGVFDRSHYEEIRDEIGAFKEDILGEYPDDEENGN